MASLLAMPWAKHPCGVYDQASWRRKPFSQRKVQVKGGVVDYWDRQPQNQHSWPPKTYKPDEQCPESLLDRTCQTKGTRAYQIICMEQMKQSSLSLVTNTWETYQKHLPFHLQFVNFWGTIWNNHVDVPERETRWNDLIIMGRSLKRRCVNTLMAFL